MSNNDVQEVRKLFQEVEVINSCKNLANNYFREAKDNLSKLEPIINQPELEFFENLLKFVSERDF